MPLYRYRCTCGIQCEEYRKIDERHTNAPEHCGAKMSMVIMPTSIQADIQPYRSVAVDKETGKRVVIESRRQHREFLRRNDYVEVGNDFAPPKRLDDGPADAPMMSMEELKKQGFIEEAL